MSQDVSRDPVRTGSLAAGTLAALLASTCCLGPLILVSLGLSGAWISHLAVLERYRPLFLAAALAALAIAWRRIYRRATACAPGEVCALPATQRVYKVLFWISAALVGVAFLFPYAAPLFY
jgi:mercuric ion transport protein